MTFEELSLILQTLVGQPVHKRLAGYSMKISFYLEPGSNQFVTIRFSSPWRYSQNGRVTLGSYDLQLEYDTFSSQEEEDKEFQFRCALSDNLEGSRLESIEIDSESSDLVMRFSDGQTLRNFTNGALDEKSWTFRDRRNGFTAVVSHAGVETVDEGAPYPERHYFDRLMAMPDPVRLTVRPMKFEDLSTVAAVWQDSKEAAFWFLPDDQADTFVENRRDLRRKWARCNLWVAEVNGIIAGFLAMNGNYVDSLYIRAEFQRSGLGTLLLDYAKGLSPEGLILEVYEKNGPARAFYESRGFQAVKSDVTAPPENEPTIEYQWRPEDFPGVARDRSPRLLKQKDRGPIKRRMGHPEAPRFGFSMLVTSVNGDVERVMEYGNMVETAEDRKLRLKWQGTPPHTRLMQFGVALTSLVVTLAAGAFFLF